MSDAMRILQLHNHHASKGGAEEVMTHERQLLINGGNLVVQYTLPAVEEMQISALRAGAKAVWNVEAARETKRRIRSFRPNVVHVHTPFPVMSPAVLRAAQGVGVPVVVTLHSFRFSCIAATCHRDGRICEDCIGRRIKWPAVKHRCYHDNVLGSAALAGSLTLHRAIGTFHGSVDRWVALTGFAKSLMIRDGFPAEKIVVKPNSVEDPGEQRIPGGGTPYVLFAGRLVPVKGLQTLLAAWARANVGPLRLLIAGDGEQRRLVQRAVEEDSRIEWLGWVEQATLSRLMAGATATVVPSEWYEAGAPLVALRSLATGTPLIVCDLDNVSAEIVSDDAALPFQTGDVESLASVLSAVAADPALLESRRRRARQCYTSRYSPDANLASLTQIYHALMV